MEKRIQIPIDLYEMMAEYILGHYDSDDSWRYHKIINGIKQKQENMERHKAYTSYKTNPDPVVREKARNEYLDRIGMHNDFRW